MKKLIWHVGQASELAQLLASAKLEESSAVNGATVYRVSGDDCEQIAIALPGGQTVFIAPEVSVHPKRRRREPE
jgi:hypothetical protein